MSEKDKPLISVLKKEGGQRTPVWFMRQAGRYLPEYRALRQQSSNFIDFCLTPELASQATLQPIDRFDLDAAILFADILLLPLALGRDVVFIEGEGPHIEAVTNMEDLQNLSFNIERIAPVFETLRLTKPRLPEKVTLIGFAGAPWTVACYMIDGQAKTGFEKAQAAAQSEELFIDFLLDTLVNTTKDYVLSQIEAGAEVIQLFDSHAGLLRSDAFARCVLEPTRRLVSFVKEKHPTVSIIGFPRGVTLTAYQEYANETGVDAVSIDPHTDLDFALHQFGGKIIQGNLDPLLLKKGGKEMEQCAQTIAEKIRKKHIFNLGHGILPETPIENVSRVIEIIRAVDGGV